MNKININCIFEDLYKFDYVLVKVPFDPLNYTFGSDFDIFCLDCSVISDSIIKTLLGLDCVVDIKVVNYGSRWHVDIYEAGSLNVRFDICSDFPIFKNISLKPYFFYELLNHDDAIFGGVAFKVPTKINEAIIRYVEYNEYFSENPDKIKHIDWIVSNLDEKLRLVFFDRLHYFLSFPLPMSPSVSHWSRYIGTFKYIYYLVHRAIEFSNHYGMALTLRKIRERLRKS
jgi:hypothetical protein